MYVGGGPQVAAMFHLMLIHGTIRANNRSQWVADFVEQQMQDNPAFTLQSLDPSVMEGPVLTHRLQDYEDEAAAPAWLRDFAREVARSDGFLVVTPEYNYGIPGALKNLFDHLYNEWNRKPFAAVGVGGISGGLRAIDMLRQVVNGLGAVMVPRHVPVQFVKKAFGPQGPTEDAERWQERVRALVDELAWYAKALKAARGQAGAR